MSDAEMPAALKTAAAEKPLPRFVGGPARSETMALECPMEFDGKVWEQITVRRLTGRELDAYVEASRDNAGAVLPIFDAPDAVIQALDASDSMRLNEIAGRFFPRPAVRP